MSERIVHVNGERQVLVPEGVVETSCGVRHDVSEFVHVLGVDLLASVCGLLGTRTVAPLVVAGVFSSGYGFAVRTAVTV